MVRPEQFAIGIPAFTELVSFTAERRGRAVRLSWRNTAWGFARFEVERSADGQAFEQIGREAVQKPRAGWESHIFDDYSLIYSFTHSLYYRLRLVAEDGNCSYSPVRVLVLHQPGSLVPYPNPARNVVTVAGAQATATVELLDALGHRIAVAWAEADGRARLLLPAGLAAGVYAVRSGSQVQRLTVE